MDINKEKQRNMLEVFNVVTSKGKKVDGAYEYLGIRASQDFDGYTCWLSYKDLTVSLLFHGKYDFDYKDKDTLKSFFNKISKLISDK
jgi:hypothetical protein